VNPLPSYNNWLYDFCAVNPQRLISAGMISPFEIDEAVAETRRAEMELGFRGISSRPNPVNIAIGTIRIMSRSGEQVDQAILFRELLLAREDQ